MILVLDYSKTQIISLIDNIIALIKVYKPEFTNKSGQELYDELFKVKPKPKRKKKKK